MGIEAWRKRVGVEPTRDVERPSPDLKSGRPTGVRFFSLSHRAVETILVSYKYVGKRSYDLAAVADPAREIHGVKILQHVDGKITPDTGLITKRLDVKAAVR